MISPRFAIVLLCATLFSGNFVQLVSAEVVQAYHEPDGGKVRWLFDGTSTPVSQTANSTTIIQAGYPHVPAPSPCKSVGLPMPPIPPAPQALSRLTTGLAAEEEGVTSITPVVIDSITPVVQMSSDRLPPPAEVPKEPTPDLPLIEFAAESLPAPEPDPEISVAVLDIPKFHYPDPCSAALDKDSFSCTCDTCIPDDNFCKRFFYVPDMIGSSPWIGGFSYGMPTMLLSRPNVAENFNASVQNRIWADYRHWDKAASMGGPQRGVEQLSFGLEVHLLKKTSVELRVPVFYHVDSNRMDSKAVELGNVSVFAKQVLLQGSRWTVSGGIGATLPTAEDWQPAPTEKLKNSAYYLTSFIGAQWHPNKKTFGHFVIQHDLPLEKNEWIIPPARGKLDGQQVMRTGIQLGRWIYHADRGNQPRRLGAFAEIDYAVITDGPTFDSRKSTFTAAVGVPMIIGRLSCTNSVILPISGHDRPFSIGYNVALTRRF